MTTGAGRPRPVESTMVGALAGAVAGLDLRPEDQAAVRLAQHYAECIDAAEAWGERQLALSKLGPALLSILESVGATPAARARIAKGVTPSGPSRLDVIRASRRA